MYEESKNNYKKVFNECIKQTEKLTLQFPEIPLYQIILNQLETLKVRLIDKEITISREELFDKYSFGSIAAKNFDDTIYGNNLMFVYGMSYKYLNLPDKLKT